MSFAWHDWDAVVIGDSLASFTWQPGSTYGAVYISVSLGGIFLPVFPVLNAPKGMVSGYDSLNQRYYLSDANKPTGIEGFTPQGVLKDRIDATIGVGKVACHFHAQGSSALYDVSAGWSWADGVPASGIVPDAVTSYPNGQNIENLWARTSQWSGKKTYEVIHNPPSGNCTVFVMLGGNDILTQTKSGGALTTHPTNPTAEAATTTLLNQGARKILEYIWRLNPNAEVVWCSYPNFAVDEPRCTDGQNWGDKPSNHGPHNTTWSNPTGGDNNPTYDSWYMNRTNPGSANPFTFPPSNGPSDMGFLKILWGGNHFVGQWTLDDGSTWFDYYSQWYADVYRGTWAQPRWLENVGFVPDYDSGWLTAQSIGNFNAQLFDVVGIRCNSGTRHLTNDTVNGVFHRILEPMYTDSAAYAASVGKSSLYKAINCWDALVSPAGMGSTYRSGGSDKFVDGVHLNSVGAPEFTDYVLSQYLPTSPWYIDAGWEIPTQGVDPRATIRMKEGLSERPSSRMLWPREQEPKSTASPRASTGVISRPCQGQMWPRPPGRHD